MPLENAANPIKKKGASRYDCTAWFEICTSKAIRWLSSPPVKVIFVSLSAALATSEQLEALEQLEAELHLR